MVNKEEPTPTEQEAEYRPAEQQEEYRPAEDVFVGGEDEEGDVEGGECEEGDAEEGDSEGDECEGGDDEEGNGGEDEERSEPERSPGAYSTYNPVQKPVDNIKPIEIQNKTNVVVPNNSSDKPKTCQII
jgi:hypothetical protein